MRSFVFAASALLLFVPACDPVDPRPDPIQCGQSALYQNAHGACASMDAKAEGGAGGAHCLCFLGYAWNGTECVGLSDCTCAGADCDKLTQTVDQCQAAHATCTQQAYTCGSSALFLKPHDVCAAMDATAAGDAGGHCNCILGFAWNGTECVGLADCACVGADCGKLARTIDECRAKHSTCSATTTITCGSRALYSRNHGACAAMDARPEGDAGGAHCSCLLGYAWNGIECVGLGDCTCVGADCDKLTRTAEECNANHTACTQPQFNCGSKALFQNSHSACAAMAATGDGMCNCIIGFAWDGTQCAGLSGCKCVGADCDKLTPTVEECQVKHGACK